MTRTISIKDVKCSTMSLLDELQRVASRAIKIAELEKRRVREDMWYEVVSYILCDLKTAVADLEDAHAAESPPPKPSFGKRGE